MECNYLNLVGKIFEAPFLYKHSKEKSDHLKMREYIITATYPECVMAKQISNGVLTSFTYTDLKKFKVIDEAQWISWTNKRRPDEQNI